MTDEQFRVVASPFASPARLALARPYTRLVDAIAVMGEGLVLGQRGRLVAFHERHLDVLQRRNTTEGIIR